MSRDGRLYLDDILECCRRVRSYTTEIVRAWSKPLIASLLIVFALSLAGWLRSLFSPYSGFAVETSVPGCQLMWGFQSPGVVIVASSRPFSRLGIRVHPESHLRLHEGRILNVGGFEIAVLPREIDGGDYIIAPHLGIVLPYWLLLVGSGLGATWLAGLLPLVWRLRVDAATRLAMICAATVLLGLNAYPEMHGPGRRVRCGEVVRTVFVTGRWPDMQCNYGWPFVCYRSASIGGVRHKVYYGADMGWTPHRFMDDVLIAALLTVAAGLAANGAFRRFPTHYSDFVPPQPKCREQSEH